MKRLVREYWKIATALVLIFFSGQVFGFVLAKRQRPSPTPLAPIVTAEAEDPATADRWTTDAVARLSEALELRPEQVAAIEPLVRASGLKVARERERALFQIHLYLLAVHDEIAPLLDEDQQAALVRSHEALVERIRERFGPLLDESHGLELRE